MGQGLAGHLLGVSIDKGERTPLPFEEELMGLSNETAARVGLHHRFSREDFHVDYGYLGGGYGVVGDLEREAITLAARYEGSRGTALTASVIQPLSSGIRYLR